MSSVATKGLTLKGYKVGFPDGEEFAPVDLEIPACAIACLLGPSGCGKTTLLRTMAGLQAALAGELWSGEEQLDGDGRRVPTERRGIGMVFQEDALFPHLSVAENVAFGLRGLTRDARRTRVNEMLGLVGLADFGTKLPHRLSGGQRQRVALARALAPRPQIMFLDEPFSNLDPALREELAIEVRRLLKQAGVTAVWVSHNLPEVFAMSDYVAVFVGHGIAQWGTPAEVYAQPANLDVACAIGEATLLDVFEVADGFLRCEVGRFATRSAPLEKPARLVVRPEDVVLVADDAPGINVCVSRREFRGAANQYLLRLPSGTELKALFSRDVVLEPGVEVRVGLGLANPVLLPASPSQARRNTGMQGRDRI